MYLGRYLSILLLAHLSCWSPPLVNPAQQILVHRQCSTSFTICTRLIRLEYLPRLWHQGSLSSCSFLGAVLGYSTSRRLSWKAGVPVHFNAVHTRYLANRTRRVCVYVSLPSSSPKLSRQAGLRTIYI
ncbi:hypothetical protein F5X98DRAFT_355271 [Xylaria grammica]|nr:hypothetical protein F5X98DRAFT_355271 [Xylaria grammica]